MAKEDMKLYQIRNHIRSKEPKKQIEFLEGIIKHSKLVSAKTKSAAYEALGDIYFRKGQDLEADKAYSKAKTKSAYLKQAKLAEKNKFYAHAANDLMDAGLSEKAAYSSVEKAAEKNGDYFTAAKFSIELGDKDKAVKLLEKDATKVYTKTIDYVVSIVLLWSGLISAMILSAKPKVVGGAMGQQLAPPMPGSWIFVVLGIFVVSVIYFLFRARSKKRGSIPLSF